MMQAADVLDGGCTCREVRFRLLSKPLFVNCCHCRWCQRETGASFALNAMIESDRVRTLAGVPEMVMTPTLSGRGQKISRCPTCRIALWSNYSGAGDAIRFVRVGTLDMPDLLPPDIHIFAEFEAALGRPATRHAGGRAILQPGEILAGRQSRTVAQPARPILTCAFPATFGLGALEPRAGLRVAFLKRNARRHEWSTGRRFPIKPTTRNGLALWNEKSRHCAAKRSSGV